MYQCLHVIRQKRLVPGRASRYKNLKPPNTLWQSRSMGMVQPEGIHGVEELVDKVVEVKDMS